jgi:uncharacterized membrane protein
MHAIISPRRYTTRPLREGDPSHGHPYARPYDLSRVAFDTHLRGRRPHKVVARLGEGAWKGASLLSIIGFFLIVQGFPRARLDVVELWTPPVWTRHITILLMLLSAILLGAYIFEKSHIAIAAHHPMVWSVAIWAAAHFLSNGSSADLVLFGAFLIWAVADPRSSFARDRRNAVVYSAPNWGATIGAVLLGVVIWIALLWLFGASPCKGYRGKQRRGPATTPRDRARRVATCGERPRHLRGSIRQAIGERSREMAGQVSRIRCNDARGAGFVEQESHGVATSHHGRQ